MKKFIALLLALAMALSLVACGGSKTEETQAAAAGETAAAAPAEDVTIQVAAIETAYGSQIWADVCAAFTETTGIKVELITDKNLEDVISASMQGGEYPDVIHLATGRPAGLTEQFIKDQAIAEITDVLSMTVPGESAIVGDKISGGFTETSLTNPYNDGKTYLAPMFYSPCGLFYNAKLFEEKGWEVPATWDEMWELGDKAAEEGISLFTYPTAGYYDAFMYALIYSIGGTEFFEAATHYEEGVWETENAQTLFAILDKLADYTHPTTPAQANNQDFTKNQLMVMTNDALFMPNGTWIVGEMAEAEATLTNDFAWGMTALPAVEAGGAGYSYCWFEQAWIPAGAENIDAAKQFIAFLYSDKACEIFATAGAIQPVNGIASMLEGDNVMFYSIYDNGAKAAMGNFAAFEAIPGIDTTTVFFDPINSLVAGTLTIEEYQANIISASEQMRANLMG
ncbi:MAG: carbohydrate ABC transporter substrate-binding protein [Oscillospiraceae bacterium]|nr:carbohydrate ABC transporter substrate-binding protein [Oscillospiraceae bacterium]